MGAQNCCSKPDEKHLEVKGGAEIVDIDKEGYPHDSEQEKVDGSKVVFEANNQVSNQEIYNKEVQSPEAGNAYEVAVAVKSPKDHVQEEQLENEQGGEEHYAEQAIGSPKPEDGHLEGEVREGEQVEDQGEEQVEEVEEQVEVEEQADGEGHGGDEGEQEEVVEEQQEEGGQIKSQEPMAMAQTVAGTTYLTADNTNNLGVQQTNGQQYQVLKNQDELNQYFNQIGNNASNVVSYNENGAFATTNATSYDVNNLQGTTEGDLNQYFQQGSSSTNANFDLNNLGATTGAAYQVSNANDYSQYFQQSSTGASATGNVDYGASSANYYQTATGTATTTTTNVDYNNLASQNTGTFDLNNLNLGQTTTTVNNVDLSQYNLGGVVSQTGNAITSTYAIPGTTTSNVAYTGGQQEGATFGEYQATQVATKKVQSTYVAPTQSYSYNYSFSSGPVTSQSQF